MSNNQKYREAFRKLYLELLKRGFYGFEPDKEFFTSLGLSKVEIIEDLKAVLSLAKEEEKELREAGEAGDFTAPIVLLVLIASYDKVEKLLRLFEEEVIIQLLEEYVVEHPNQAKGIKIGGPYPLGELSLERLIDEIKQQTPYGMGVLDSLMKILEETGTSDFINSLLKCKERNQ